MSALSDVFDVLEHLVSTHPTWNQTMSRDVALAKVAAAKAEELLKFAAPLANVVASDVVGHPVVLPVLADVEKVLSEVAGTDVTAP